MKMLHTAFALIIVQFTGSYVFAQSPNPYLLQKVDIKGLPRNMLYTSALQDNKGFLWVGTINGLYRYDGFRVTAFLNKPTDSTSLSHNYVQCLEQDDKGNIWIGTYGAGLNKFNFNKSATERINQDIKGNDNLVIKTLFSLKSNCLWIATPGMLQKFSMNQGIVQKFAVLAAIKPQTGIHDIIELTENKILLATGQGLYLADAAKNQVNSLSLGNIYPDKEQPGFFNCLIKDATGNIIVGGNKGLMILDSKSLQPVYTFSSALEQAFGKDTILKLYKDVDQKLWIATKHKLFVYNPATTIINEFSDPLTNISDITQDQQGSIWVATEKQGLFRIVTPSLNFQTIQGLTQFSKAEIIYQLAEETDSTWLIGTKYNLVRYNNRTGLLEKINIDTHKDRPGINSILIDSKKNYWIGTELEGVQLKPAGTNNFSRVSFKMQDTVTSVPDYVLSFIEDKNGKIWGGIFANTEFSSGLFLYNSIQKQFEQIVFPVSDSSFLKPSVISQLQNGSNNDIWAGTWNGGLFRINSINKKQVILDNLSIKSSPEKRITLNVVSSVILDKKGLVWFGTVGGGLNCYDPTKKTIEYFTIADGLASNLIYRIEEDDFGYLWISTNNGISRFDKKTNHFINYHTTSGLSSANFSFLSSLKCKNGTIAFGTNDGQVIYFNPSSLQNKKNTLPTIITDIRLANKSILPSEESVLERAAYLTDTVRLNYSQSVISFELANMDFVDPETYTYAYKLNGFDKLWTYTTARNSITYTNLDPGTYTLLVKNANHFGIWNETPTSLTLIIKPPYWMTWWFITLIVLAASALFYALFRYRLHQQLRVLQIRNRLHRDLHDDIGATLSSVKVYSEILNNNPNNPVIAELIQNNSTEMIERLEVIAWATDPQHDNFKSLKNSMIKFAAPLCHSKNIVYKIESHKIKEDMQMGGEVRQNIFLVFKEALNNMIKYSEATTCNTNIFINNNQFVLQVIDNGKGFDGVIKGSGNGWKNIKRRAEELQGKLMIESPRGKGTSISMTLPYPFKIPSSWDRKQHKH